MRIRQWYSGRVLQESIIQTVVGIVQRLVFESVLWSPHTTLSKPTDGIPAHAIHSQLVVSCTAVRWDGNKTSLVCDRNRVSVYRRRGTSVLTCQSVAKWYTQ